MLCILIEQWFHFAGIKDQMKVSLSLFLSKVLSKSTIFESSHHKLSWLQSDKNHFLTTNKWCFRCGGGHDTWHLFIDDGSIFQTKKRNVGNFCGCKSWRWSEPLVYICSKRYQVFNLQNEPKLLFKRMLEC